jgi:ABC-type Zn2+ transport system substrate-binding protein/surface adhesin
MIAKCSATQELAFLRDRHLLTIDPIWIIASVTEIEFRQNLGGNHFFPNTVYKKEPSMSHHHEHEHCHTHEHQHENGHTHEHDHGTPGTLSFSEKMVKLFDHWITHNDDHASNYRDWAAKAAAENLPEAAALLKEAADMTRQISEKFEAAAKSMTP